MKYWKQIDYCHLGFSKYCNYIFQILTVALYLIQKIIPQNTHITNDIPFPWIAGSQETYISRFFKNICDHSVYTFHLTDLSKKYHFNSLQFHPLLYLDGFAFWRAYLKKMNINQRINILNFWTWNIIDVTYGGYINIILWVIACKSFKVVHIIHQKHNFFPTVHTPHR